MVEPVTWAFRLSLCADAFEYVTLPCVLHNLYTMLFTCAKRRPSPDFDSNFDFTDLFYFTHNQFCQACNGCVHVASLSNFTVCFSRKSSFRSRHSASRLPRFRLQKGSPIHWSAHSSLEPLARTWRALAHHPLPGEPEGEKIATPTQSVAD